MSPRTVRLEHSCLGRTQASHTSECTLSVAVGLVELKKRQFQCA